MRTGRSERHCESPSGWIRETQADDLLTVATFRNYVHAQLAQTRLLASGILAFLFDDNTIRMNWFLATALGFVKLRVPRVEAVEALEILGLDPGARAGSTAS